MKCNIFPFFFYSLWAVGVISGRVRALNLTVPLGSGRVGSDDLGYGPGSGFSFEPVQTSRRMMWVLRHGIILNDTGEWLLDVHVEECCYSSVNDWRVFWLMGWKVRGISSTLIKGWDHLNGCLWRWTALQTSDKPQLVPPTKINGHICIPPH